MSLICPVESGDLPCNARFLLAFQNFVDLKENIPKKISHGSARKISRGGCSPKPVFKHYAEWRVSESPRVTIPTSDPSFLPTLVYPTGLFPSPQVSLSVYSDRGATSNPGAIDNYELCLLLCEPRSTRALLFCTSFCLRFGDSYSAFSVSGWARTISDAQYIYKSSYWNGSVTPHITLGRPPLPLPPLPFVSLFNMSVMLGPVPSQDLLPSYSRRQHQQRRRHSAMPGSTRSTDTPEPTTQRQTEHVFELTSPSRACLKIMSSAKTSKSLPTYFEKEVIKGEVEVDLDRGGTVIGVTAMVRLSYLILSLNTSSSNDFHLDIRTDYHWIARCHLP